MASQSPFFSSPIPIINNKTHSFAPQPNNYHFFTFKNSKILSSLNSQEPENAKQDPIELAFGKESFIERLEALKSDDQPEDASDDKEVPLALKLAMEKAKEYKKNKGVVGSEATSSSKSFQELDKKNEALQSDEVIRNDDNYLAVKLALEKKANEDKNSNGVVDISETTASEILGGNWRSSTEKKPVEDTGKNEELSVSGIVQDSPVKEVEEKNTDIKSGDVVKNDPEEKEVPLAVKLALEKAKEYKKDKGVVGISRASASGLAGQNEKSLEEKKPVKNAGKKISSIDFVGLNFSDKKRGRGLPPGLVPVSDPFLEGDYPEVEILVGDASKFGNVAPSSNPIAPAEDDEELYKPKVTTWGFFPRPNDISKAYGGGRTLRPGEALESAEERAAKQAKTKKMIAAYRAKIGLSIDPKLKSECEKCKA